MANLGELYYSLGVKEDAQLDKKLDNIKNKLSGLKFEISIDPSTLDTLTKLTNSASALSEINKKLGLSASQLASQQRQDAVAAARTAAIQNTANNQTLLSQQRIATEAERTALVHERLRQSVERAANAQKNLAEKSAFTNKTFTNQRVIAYQLANALGQAFSIYAVGAFVKKLAEVRGEFELQQVALRSILRDYQAADKIFSQVKTLSVKSPFTFSELLRDTKQLAAFSVETDKLFGTLTRLADVSAGLGVDMNRIILAYGQVRSATVLRGQELRQFTEAGIPIIDMLAQKFTKLEGTVVSAGDVFERISKKMVSFKDVDEVFTQLTSSGGMFFEMQKKQSETLAGKLANLKDAYMIMLNGIGEANDGILKGGANALYTFMNNWESIADVLKVVIAAYGAYKVSAIAVTAINGFQATSWQALAMATTATTIAEGREIVVKNALAAAQARLNSTMLANPYVLAAAAIVTLGVAIYNTYQNAHELENALNKIKEEESASAQAQVIHLDILTSKLKGLNEPTEERKRLITEINNVAGDYLSNLIKESDTYDEIIKKLGGVNAAIWENAKAKAQQSATTKVTDELTRGITEAQKALETALSGVGIKGELSANVIGRMLGDIQKNPKLAQDINSLIDYINKTITEATGKVSKLSIINAGSSIVAASQMGAMGKTSPLEGIISGLKDFYDVTVKTTAESNKLNASIYAWGIAGKSVPDEIKKITDARDADLKKSTSEEERTKIKVKALLEEAGAYRKLGQEKKAIVAESEAAGLDPLSSEIGRFAAKVKDLKEYSTDIFNIDSLVQDGKTMKDVTETVSSSLKDYEQELLRMKAANEGSKSGLKIYSDPEITRVQKLVDLYKAISKIVPDITLKQEKKEETAAQKQLVDSIQAQVTVIKEAQAAYEKYKKVMTVPAAKAKVEEQYPGISVNESTIKDKLKSLYDALGKTNTESATKLKAAIKQEINAIEEKGIEDSFDKLILKAKRYINDNKDKFDMYKMIEDITGNKQLAMEISFGVEFKDKDIKDKLREQIMTLGSEFGVDVSSVVNDSLRNVSFEDLLSKSNLSEATKEVQDQFKVVFDALKGYEQSEYKDSLTRTAALLKEYGSAETKKAAIKIEFGKKLADAEKNELGLSEQNKIALINNIKTAQTEALDEIDATAFRLSDTYRELFGDMEKYSVKRIKSIIEANQYIIDQTKGQKAIDGKFTVKEITGEERKVPEKEITSLVKQIEKVKSDLQKDDPFLKISEGLKLIEAGGEDATTGLIAVAQGISSVIGIISPLTDVINELGVATENTGMQNFANDMKLAAEWGQSLANLGTALATGNVAAIAGSLIDITAKLIKAEAEYQSAKRKFLLENIKLQYEYNNLLLAEQLQFASGTTIFGTDAYGRAVNSIKAYRDAISQTITEMEKLGDAEIIAGVKRKKSGFWGALISPAAAIATLVTGGGATVGTANAYGKLLEVEKELINTDGTLNVNRAKALLATDKLTESTRQLLQQLVDLDQKAKDAYAQMTEYLTNVFGSLGQSLSDSIVKAFKDGTDASLAFKTSVEGTIEKLTEDLMYSLFLQDYFTKFQKEIEAIYGETGITQEDANRKVINLMSDFFDNIGGVISNSEEFLANMQDAAAAKGLDIFKKTPTSASTGASIQSLTEDTGSKLASILNGMYGIVGTQNITLKSIESVLVNTGSVTANSLAQLVLIQSNTYQTVQLLKSVIGGRGSQGDGIRVWTM